MPDSKSLPAVGDSADLATTQIEEPTRSPEVARDRDPAGQSNEVDRALARAIDKATEAGDFDAVVRIVNAARMRPAGASTPALAKATAPEPATGNVVALDPAKRGGSR